MISGLGQNGFGHQALEIFSKMLADGEKPNMVTFATVFSASSQLKQIALGKSLHGFSLKYGFMDKVDIIFQTSLLHMYANSGNIHHARKIFDEMSERNMVSWNIIMDAFFSNGLFGKALSLFKEMISAGWRYPRSSIITLVLQICGISTDIRMGKEVHGFMLKCIKGILDPESALECNSIIDMYIKAGDLESAILLFDRMPERNLVTWTTLILGYGIHGLSVEALEAFNEMKRSGISPDEIAFIAILSACNHGGLLNEGRELSIL
ncbi:hypothetical protein HPP92_023071 [Vanilla planifolia]|uniref:Pentatricopeptide repeat-containing protein n=1 Tax=Vanilla planifolia TaxID=51239 RepID=A0A835PVX5_VANPL|nr:hypothetical protein HPP92_023071 [Vanilla planifolia]